MKAEEIRRLIINDLFLNMFDEDAEYTLERIDEYAAEVSRETIEECKKTLLKQLHPMIYRQSKDTFYVFDEYGMLTVKSDTLSWRDSIGMTVCAWIAYGMPGKLRYSLHKCWGVRQWKPKTVIGIIINGLLPNRILYRHPNKREKASRDHYSYYIIHAKLSMQVDQWFKLFIKGLPRMRGLN
ncbi:MAG TPA: hypothetical protein VMW53_07060, partial [archaeon]|nr:hypothetical protein [archaeon]